MDPAAALETIFGANVDLSHVEQSKMLSNHQESFFEKIGVKYGGQKITLTNMERALRFYGMYLEEKKRESHGHGGGLS